MNYDFNKLIGEAIKHIDDCLKLAYFSDKIDLLKCYFVRAAKEAKTNGYEYQEFFMNCNLVLGNLQNKYLLHLENILNTAKSKNKNDLTRELIKGNDFVANKTIIYEGAQIRGNKAQIKRLEGYIEAFKNVFCRSVTESLYGSKNTLFLNSMYSTTIDYYPMHEYDIDIPYSYIEALILCLDRAKKELMLAEPQPSATNQAAEAKHYNYTITTKQQQYMFNELIKNGYIAPDTDFNSFCFAISGTPIKTEFVPINWLPMLKDLYCFISEFFAAEKANKQKAVYCFVWQKKTIKIKSLTNLNFSNGEPPSADYFKELKKQISEV